MRSRPILLFMLLLSTEYAASTSAYADQVIPYWDEQVMQAPETTSPTALCISAIALVATLLLHRRRPGPQGQQDFDSETLVFSRSQH